MHINQSTMSDIHKLLKNVLDNESLAPYSLYKAGARAKYLYLAKDKKDAKKAETVAKEAKIPYTTVPNTNFVAIDDIDGLVILIHSDDSKKCFKDVKLIKGEKKLKNEAQGQINKHLDQRLEDWVVDSGKITSAWLIEQADLVGYKIGNVRISLEDANCMNNLGDASPEEVITLLSYIKQQVRDRFGIQLENEVMILEGN